MARMQVIYPLAYLRYAQVYIR